MFLVSALLIGFLAVAIFLNMRAGFSNYLASSVLARFDRLEQALADAYQPEVGSWPALNGDNRAWRQFVRAIEPPRRPAPEQRRPPGPRDPLGVGNRMGLLDAQGNLIVGGRPGQTILSQRAIHKEGKVVGWLALYAPPRQIRAGDDLFLRDQLTVLLIASVLTLGLSAGAAFFLSRQFLKPLEDVAKAGEALARGDYSIRLIKRRDDELGALIEQFNTLAGNLELRDERERRWISDTAHELKTPLALLKAQIEAFQDGVRKPDISNLEQLHASVERLATLVSDLNHLTEVVETAHQSTTSSIDLSALVKEIAHSFDPAMTEAGLALQLKVEDGLLAACDATKLERLLLNLLKNALDYTDAPGTIRIELTKQGESIRLSLEDSAPMPNTRPLDRLFDRFYRDDHSRDRRTGGSGLGLSICREIVLAMGGTITLNPSSLGGLRVEIQLPAGA